MNPDPLYTSTDHATLLQVAHDTISHGLRNGRPSDIAPQTYPKSLREWAATFVTLKTGGVLRGCIGTLQAVRPLVEDVNENAYAAAFRDPRFLPLSDRELVKLQISISILTTPEPISFRSQQDLLAQLQAGIDGVILEEGSNRGTFLPAVWESLPDPREFLRQLKLKAGLHPDYWSTTLRIYRYRTEVIDRS